MRRPINGVLVIEKAEVKLDRGSYSQPVEGNFSPVGDCVSIAILSSIVLEDKGSSRSQAMGKGDRASNWLLNDILFNALGGNGEEDLLADCEDLGGKILVVSRLAKLVDVLGEDVGNEKQICNSVVWGDDGEGVDVVESSIDLDGGATGISGELEASDAIYGISGVRKMVVSLVQSCRAGSSLNDSNG